MSDCLGSEQPHILAAHGNALAAAAVSALTDPGGQGAAALGRRRH